MRRKKLAVAGNDVHPEVFAQEERDLTSRGTPAGGQALPRAHLLVTMTSPCCGHTMGTEACVKRACPI